MPLKRIITATEVGTSIQEGNRHDNLKSQGSSKVNVNCTAVYKLKWMIM